MRITSTHQRVGRHLQAGDIRLHYIRIGKGGRQPLVVLPGITSPAATWEFVVQQLAHYVDVYIMDIRGRGLSSTGPHLSYKLDDYARDLQALIDELDLESPFILGHSMGARIAINFAAHNNYNIKKLILVDPPVSGPGRRPYPIELQYYLKSINDVSRGLGYEELKTQFGWTDRQIDDRMEWLPTCDPYAISESHRYFHEEDIHKYFPEIHTPTLLLYAEYGNTVTDEDAAEIGRLLKFCEVTKIHNSGHMIPWDQLEKFTDIVIKFLGYDMAIPIPMIPHG